MNRREIWCKDRDSFKAMLHATFEAFDKDCGPQGYDTFTTIAAHNEKTLFIPHRPKDNAIVVIGPTTP